MVIRYSVQDINLSHGEEKMNSKKTGQLAWMCQKHLNG